MPRRATSVSPNPTSRSIPGTPLCRATGPRDSSGGSDPIVGATCARAEGRCSKMRHNFSWPWWLDSERSGKIRQHILIGRNQSQ